MSNDLFGEVIFSYSRAQAIEDGVLIDISKLSQEAGISFHCAMTEALHTALTPTVLAEAAGQSLEGRIWDMLTVFMVEAKKSSRSQIQFTFIVSGRNFKLKAICGPGDDPTPVITFMLPEED